MQKIILLLALFINSIGIHAQVIQGIVFRDNVPLMGAHVSIDYKQKSVITDSFGHYAFIGLPSGIHKVQVKAGDYSSGWEAVTLSSSSDTVMHSHFIDEKVPQELESVVVSSRKVFQRDHKSATIINVMNTEMLQNLQSCNLADGLKFQPGLRVETDCQTCNYTQLRMNGLQGSYAQILINGRPIVSPMMMLYGLEQLPVSMIERLEVTRGVGNTMYGAAAIGGTIDLITKLPSANAYSVDMVYNRIGGDADDYIFNTNGTWVNKKKDLGLSAFANYRHRSYYDANGDNFSELPMLENKGVGMTGFYLPRDQQKLEWSVSYLDEYRTGGDMLQRVPQLARQNEERKHEVLMSSIDYQYNIIPDQSSIIAYAAMSNARRSHFTGVLPDSPTEISAYQLDPPYGSSYSRTMQIGAQYNHKFDKFLIGSNTVTAGAEYATDRVYDHIPAYNFLIDQSTRNFISFLQSQWAITPRWTVFSGLRNDVHSMVRKPVHNARIAIMYRHRPNAQLRISYGTGYRPPQAFDTDMHLAFAGGGISRIIIDSNLRYERSRSITTSFNYDKYIQRLVYGFTLEGFYTMLSDVFTINSIGADSVGELFWKTNGLGASVYGTTLELRANYNRQWQWESGMTLQRSVYAADIVYIDGKYSGRDYLRTPNVYGFGSLTWTPDKSWTVNVNGVYTGSMKLARFGGSELYSEDALIQTPSMTELNARIAYRHHIHRIEHDLVLSIGVKNMLNAYQRDFDIGKNRDSNYIYGPSQPSTVFAGIRWEFSR